LESFTLWPFPTSASKRILVQR